MPRVRRRMLARPESSYRIRRVDGATYFTSRRRFDDLTIVVQRFPGPPVPGPDFVLVHGVAVSSRYFTPAAARLSQLGQVYLVDLPGHGAAPDPRRDVSIADHAAVLGAFLSEAGMRNPVLVGHSWGSQVVSQLAVDHPEVSDRIVLMAPTLEPQRRTFWSAVGRLVVDGTREPPTVVLLNIWEYWVRCGLPFALAQMRHLLADRIEERLPQVAARTLVMRGDADPIVSDEWCARVTALLPDARFETVVGPHVVMHTDPVRVAELIAEHAQLAERS
ncbi:alpha/beta fold hydrolase [Salinibacterium soli]|uniref:Alpha/beta hydrolase n=1 Tax=Antiquaquibacter soli TaxID=3064523 RepID=A0ABT9BMK4_9MICO|nr:alpha/beta hydrolase [Protaetiibacter sp. WY-16]MDO7882240.1 alpha/beta hydrolase [Protaetiibacter sp. WY-16]